MPLPAAPVPRTPLHHRKIDLQGYERADGKWDIEGRVTDTKSYGFDNQDRGRVEPGMAVHDMWIRVTVDETMTICDAVAVIDAGPYDICADIAPAFAGLRGLTIGPGWYGKVRQQLGGTKGCTHVVELLQPLATAALQTVFPALRKKREAATTGSGSKPMRLNGCHALASDGPLVRERMPAYYTGLKD